MPSRPRLRVGGHSSNQTCKPNSVAGLATGMTIIPLARQSLAGSSDSEGSAAKLLCPRDRTQASQLSPVAHPSDLPGGWARRAGTRSEELPPYLVLLRVGFALPRRLLAGRCALTAPFHPYLARSPKTLVKPRILRRTGGAVYFLWHFPSSCPAWRDGTPRRYLAHRSVEFGLSSPRVSVERLHRQ